MRPNWKLIVGLLLAIPTLAHAHSAGLAVNGWHDGFSHPLHGWDHLIVMVGVGWWAAQQRGRAVWLIPLTFVGVMTFGGVVGASGLSLPGIEMAILLSVVVFTALVIKKARMNLTASVPLVGFFGFFHGFAHGSEMPASAGIVMFGAGFVLATLLLHALGLAAGRTFAFLTACLVGGSSALAQTTNTPAAPSNANAASTHQATVLPEVVVTGRQDSMLGIAASASQGVVGAREIQERPILRAGEILETIPGMIITQHAGGGKANQYFLRGFNLDHSTDFATYLDGMPLNLPSHAHGEGYSDMNTVIPEFVQRLDYEKGPYDPTVGNYGSAGSADLIFYKSLPQDFVTLEGGMNDFERGVFGRSQNLGPGTILYGGEAYHDDGPWMHPDNYWKFNGLVTFSGDNDATGYSLTTRAYHGAWNSSDQIPEEAVSLVGLYGALDPSDGGQSDRYSLQAEWHRASEISQTKVTAYGFYYDLNLFSDFTYYLTDPTNGDQFEQQDRRWVGGLDARHTLFSQWFGRDVQNSFGAQVRNDWINNGLYQTEDRIRVDKTDASTGTVLPATTQADRFTDTEAGIYAENKIQWSDKFRTMAAIRGDLDYFDVTSLTTPANSGTSATALPSPKLTLTFGPWDKTEFYLDGGFSFHSNDGRGATQTVEPVSADNPYPNTQSNKIPGLIQTKGAEVGLRTLPVPHLQSALSLWYLYSDSELQQDGDTGSTVPSRQPSNRYGVEWANYYTPVEHLTLDFDFADSIARFTSPDPDDAAPINPGSTTLGPGGTRVPEAVGAVIASGLTLDTWHGFSTSLRLRFFGPRDLTSDGLYRSQPTLLLNLETSYQINKTWRFFAEFLNLLDSHDHDIDYAYTSQITPNSKPVFNDVFHPVEPFQARFGLTAQF